MRCNFFFLFFFPLCAWGGVSEGVRGREGGERGKVFVCARVCLGVFRIRKSQKKSCLFQQTKLAGSTKRNDAKIIQGE